MPQKRYENGVIMAFFDDDFRPVDESEATIARFYRDDWSLSGWLRVTEDQRQRAKRYTAEEREEIERKVQSLWHKPMPVVSQGVVTNSRLSFHYPGGHDHDQSTHGHRGAIRDHLDDEEVSALLDEFKRTGGFTYQPIMKNSPKEGFVVSIFPQYQKIIPGKGLTAEQVEDYMEKHAEVLNFDPRAHLGAWLDTESERVYLDVSIVEPDRRKAVDLGIEYNQ